MPKSLNYGRYNPRLYVSLNPSTIIILTTYNHGIAES